MKKSERNLLIATVLVVGVTAWLLFAPENPSGATGGTGDVAAARKTFRNYAETLRDSAAIKEEFRKIGGRTVATGGQQGPREVFSDELYTLLRDQGFPTPPLETPTYATIENVGDYCTVDIKVTIASPLPGLISLLTQMERRGMLVKSFTLDRRNARDASEITLTVTVARVIKQDDESRRRLYPGRTYTR